uniref:Immunoglobulin V-set domain-containing protein n=1 Tax=Anolis carolinensis TaxID=28377 RepID=A0A803TQR1_ANOCA
MSYILSSCLSLASALNYTILVTVDPWFPLVGMGATLVAKGGMENFISCSWYRWEISDPSLILVYDTSTKKVQHKPAYTGRETLRKNCSLYIEKLSIEDITYFFILKNSTTSSEAGQVFLVIKGKMFLESVKLDALEEYSASFHTLKLYVLLLKCPISSSLELYLLPKF